MKGHSMRRRLLLLVLAALPAAGCANLVVHKVPVDQRVAGADDHVDGFRYYLSRPHVLVKEKIEVSRTESLVLIEKGGAVQFLDGAGAGKTVPLDQLTTTNPGTGATQRVSEAELEAMRNLIKTRPEPVNNPSSTDADVRPAALAAPLPDDSVTAFATAGPAWPTDARPALLPSPRAASPTPEPPATDRKSAQLTGAIQIVFLPDMDEQYAIHSRNFVSKTSFTLKFRDGWGLSDVYGDHDSTPVALELFNVIDQAIDTAKTLALAQMKKDADGGGKGFREEFSPQTFPAANEVNIYKLVQITYIKPGLYRLNKPWEAGEPKPTGCGFLTKLGLETVTIAELRLATRAMRAERVEEKK